ncbi:RNA polymerase II C-terminal domain phosphatase-like 4 [Impatiens glandulifera]|uniref:RNA polymerase II C-terminal domain phosphatase-like 4 n=1 Tax=Impatiens glandulifera TaxID=253017 RepID=UPI001FB05609|nr:RNA polymerase II C-terminal domain phosphatase-like 4 [Impatiens glandulifera]
MTQFRQIDLKNKIKEKKLHLILDLDHTLLHSFNMENFGKDKMSEIFTTKDLQKNLFFFNEFNMVTKLRPFVFDFLKEANNLFQLWIYTMGTRDYAKRMAKLIDPDETLFGCRIISQEDCTIRGQKGLDVVYADEKTILIVDDTVSVWSNHLRNLINVNRFNFFGTSKYMKEREFEDYELSNVFYLLKKTHTMFFDPKIGTTEIIDRDVRDYLKLAVNEIFSNM